MPKKGKTVIPSKAFLDDEIAKKHAKVGGASAHKVKSVIFTDEVSMRDVNGRERIGFFKPLDDDHTSDSYYPKILALLSVGISALFRMNLGERAAEDRLVYNSQGKLIGTVSLGIDSFMHMQVKYGETITDKHKKALANPSTLDLIDRNAADILLNAWYRKNRDLHPHNIGTGKVTYLEDGKLKEKLEIVTLDFDNCHSNVTDAIRGKRFVQGFMTKLTHLACKLGKNELINFPCVDTRDHWPTQIPQHGAVLKIYNVQDHFTELKERKDFHEQKHFALLKILLAYQPDVMQARLTDLLGDEKLNLSALPEPARQELLKDNTPQLFYKEPNKPQTADNELTIVEHLMRSEERYYDELYRLTVKNKDYNDFNHYIITHPEAFQHALDWFKEQNELNRLKADRKTPRQTALHQEHPFDIEQFESRYIKIWQDAALNTLSYTSNKKLKPIIEQLEAQIELKSRQFKWQPPPSNALEISEAGDTLLDNLPSDKDAQAHLNHEIEHLKIALKTLGEFFQFSREKIQYLEYDLSPSRESNKELVQEWSERLAKTKEVALPAIENDRLKDLCLAALTEWENGLTRIDYDAHVQARERKLEEEATPYLHYGWSEPEDLPDSPATFCSERLYASPSTAEKITAALIEWLSLEDHTQVVKACREAKTEYDQRPAALVKKFAFWATPDRDIDKILKSRGQTNYQLLHTIFKEGGWDTSSYNTTLLKKLLEKMKRNTDVSFKSNHPVVDSIQLDAESLNDHIGFLKKELVIKLRDTVIHSPTHSFA